MAACPFFGKALVQRFQCETGSTSSKSQHNAKVLGTTDERLSPGWECLRGPRSLPHGPAIPWGASTNGVAANDGLHQDAVAWQARLS